MTYEEAKKLLEDYEEMIECNNSAAWTWEELQEIKELISAAKTVAKEELKDEQRRDMSWANWEEDFAETWMDINPNHGQANAKCYIKKLVDKYVEKARVEQRKEDAEIVRGIQNFCDTNGYPMGGSQGIARMFMGKLQEKILNPEAQQAIIPNQ